MRVFYKSAAVAPTPDGFVVTLDGKPLKTPGKAPMVLESLPLAEAIAAEWQAQEGEINPASMQLMKLAATAIDRVSTRRAEVIAGTAAYANSDLLCYRAELPDELVSRQASVWQPLLDWASLRFDAPLLVTQGILAIAQPEASTRALAGAVAALDLFDLTAVADLTGLMGSLVLALALWDRKIDAKAAADAALLDEDIQAQRWGVDDEAAERLAAIRAEIRDGDRFMALHRAGRKR